MKAAGYIRVSTIGQTENESLDLQREAIQKHINENSWELIKIYEDPGVSGAKDKRPGLDALRQAARNHEFDILVVRDLTRFGRSARDLLNNIEELKGYGIDFVSIKGNHDTSTSEGRLMLTLLSAIAEFERDIIMQRTNEGKMAKWTSHRAWVGLLPYGFTWDEETGKIIQVEEEVKIYKRIVTEYLELNYSFNDICIRLNSEHIPTRHGKRWNTAGLSQLLRNSMHHGTAVVNTHRLDAKGKIIGDKPEDEHIVWEVPEIITRARWDKVQAKAATGLLRAGRPNKFKETFLLHGLLKCGVCGAAIVPYRSVPTGPGKVRLQYYKCRWHHASNKEREIMRKERCDLPTLPAEPLEDWVYNVRLLGKLGANKETVYEPLIDQEQWNEKIQAQQQTISNIKAEIAKKERGARKLRLAFMQDGDEDDPADIAIFKSDHKHLLHEITYLKQDLEEALKQLQHYVELRDDQEKFAHLMSNDEQMDELHEKVRTLPFAQKRRLLEGLLEGPIEVKPPDWLTDEEIALLGQTRYRIVICNNARMTFHFNQPILHEILDLDKYLDKSRSRWISACGRRKTGPF
jgi:site-specific DNA recombinase